MSNKIEVVLLQSVKALGNKDDVVSVAIPYARNVLIAQGKAKVADKAALEAMKQKQEKHDKHEAEAMATFKQIEVRRAEGGALKIQKKSTPNGHLYEKVSAKEIQSALDQSAQVKSDLSRIQIDGKIDEIGEKLVKITYKGKSIKVPVTIM